MPKIEKLPSGNYRMRGYATDTLGQKITKSFTAPSKKEVMFLYAQWNEDNRAENITVSQAIDRYIELREPLLSPRTISEYKKMKKNWLTLLLEIKCNDMTTDKMQQAVSYEAKRGLSHKSIKNAVNLYSSAIRAVNPRFSSEKIVLPQRKQTIYKTPDADTLARIYAMVKGTTVELPVLLASQCSLRLSEVMGIEWENVNMEQKYIDIVQARVHVAGKGDVVKLPKTPESTRRIYMTKAVEDKLRETPRVSSFVVPQAWQTIESSYKQKVSSKIGVNFHELRHAYASNLLALGVPNKYIMKMGGWKTDDILSRVYQQTFDSSEEKFASIANKFFQSLFPGDTKSDTKSDTNA